MVFSAFRRPGRRGAPGAISVLGCSLLVGCGSFGGTGESEFACPGYPAGVSCKSPIDVYEATNGPGDTLSGGGGALSAAGTSAAAAGKAGAALTTPLVVQRNLIVAPPNPKPILEEAQVMRIWIAPFVDNNQDLQWPGFTYTEVTPRRWAFGEVEVEQIRQTAPLQVAATPAAPAGAGPRPPKEYTVGRPRAGSAPGAPPAPPAPGAPPTAGARPGVAADSGLGPAYMRHQAPKLDERAYDRSVNDLLNAN